MKIASQEKAGARFFNSEAVIEMYDVRCPICRWILHVEQLSCGPVFVCKCILKGEVDGTDQ